MDTTRTLTAAAIAAVALPSIAQSLTVVNEPLPGEASHAEMLADAFGGSFASLGTTEGVNFHSSNGNTLTDIGFTNGSVTARRVADLGSAVNPDLTDLSAGDDSSFAKGSYRADFLQGYSSLSHDFGAMTEEGEFRSLVGDSGRTFRSYHPDADFDWALSTSNGRMFYSDAAGNDGKDHMVTYGIYDDADQLIAAVLFFEDWGGAGSDWDYNDSAVLLTLAPTPQAALLGLAGLGGIGLAAGRRRR